ncbi:protein FAM234A isoform X2 [Bubalus kerabau]|uniref:protein FAM234A isoform X2 n=1 Tax=Bubalus carabanensis TaxID=3119969 RepID=UPI00244EB191|nr:protein FAM234A isoform X2 [Bubalus carabanensis]
MTDGKDLEAEIHPLKSENRKVPENAGGPAGKEPRKTPAPQTRLSRCRTAAFFLSLFACLLVVFVVSFIIPCPDRPASQGVWRIDYNAAVAYDFLAAEDVNKDKIQDILFLYKNTNSSRSNSSLSCADEGFSCPCTFVAAVSGASGSVLWERPVAQDGAFVECGVLQPRGSAAPSACVVLGRPGSLVAVDTLTGKTLWSQPSSFRGNASVLSPLLRVPDLDADGAPDLLVLIQEENQVNGSIYSGGTGQQVSPPDSLGVDGTSGSILHVTRAGAHYVLIPCGTALCSRSVKGLYEKVSRRDSPLKSDPLWEDMLSAASHRLVVHRKPVLGYYKPDTPAVLVENGTGPNRQVLLLDLGSGAVLWSQALPGLPGDPPSASLPTADHRSAFFFWGVHEPTDSNQTEPGATGRRLYMLHPTLPGVLLELDNVSAPIVAFQVVLLEPGRHAACILLTGPASPNPPGLVSVTKQKVQDLVLAGRVVHLAEGGTESDQAVRDRLSRLRYRSEA